MLGYAKLKNRNEFALSIDKMVSGLNVLYSDVRLDEDECAESTNLMLVEDGVLKKRWGTETYTTATFTNRPDGFSEYRKTDGTRELIVIADGFAYKVAENGTKTELSGATFTVGYRAYFLQYNNYLYIANGEDSLARYDGSSLSTYAGIDTPTWDGTPLTRGSGLSAGSYTYYYQVTAINSVGETLCAAEQSIAANVQRENWDDVSTEYIDLAWADVSGATGYKVYFSDSSGNEVFLAQVPTSQYRDDGTMVPNDQIEPPDTNTTTAPKFTHMEVIKNRIWATGDPNNPYRVYVAGVGVNKGQFGSSDSFWVDIGYGGREVALGIVSHHGSAHLITRADDGKGSVWEIVLEDQTFSFGTLTQTFIVPVPTQIIPNTGCHSARTITHVENDIFFLNKQGVYLMGYEPNYSDDLRTAELSAKVRSYIDGLDDDSFDKACAFYIDGKVLFSVSSASGEPDQIIIFDRERGAWIGHWTVGVSQFGQYTDTSGVTHLLGITSDKLIEFSENFESDEGTAFTWTYKSPKLPITKDWSAFGKIKKAYVKLRNATGTIAVTLSGTGKTGNYSAVGSATINPGNSTSGLGWDLFGQYQLGYTAGTSTQFAIESLVRYIQLQNKNNLVRDIQWKVQGDSVGDTAVIIGLIVKGRKTNQQVPLSNKL